MWCYNFLIAEYEREAVDDNISYRACLLPNGLNA